MTNQIPHEPVNPIRYLKQAWKQGLTGGMKISTKLGFGFGMLVALTMVVVALNFFSGNKVNTTIEHTQKQRVPLMLAASKAQADILKILGDVHGYLATGAPHFLDDYRLSEKRFVADLERLEGLLIEFGSQKNKTQYSALKESFEKWNRLPDVLFALRNNKMKREPAYAWMNTTGAKLSGEIIVNIKQLIQIQSEQAPSSQNNIILKDLSELQSSFTEIFSSLRTLVATRNPNFRFEYYANQTINNDIWANVIQQRELLPPRSQKVLDRIADTRERLWSQLPEKIFSVLDSDQWRQDLYLFKTEAVPLAEEMRQLLKEMAENSQQLFERDMEKGVNDLAFFRWLTLAVGIIALTLGAGLSFFLGRNIIVPVRLLTEVARKIQRGDLDAQAQIRSADEIGTLAATFNQMTGRLRQTLSDLQENMEWLQTILRSIGDAVIATDTSGKVTFMNPVAESLTGWNQSESTGKPLEDVFYIINEKTREPVENPVKNVIRKGSIVGLANHTLLIGRNGTEIPMDDSGAPIVDEQGDMKGVVLIFRDVGEKRRSEKELRKYHEHLEELVEERTKELARAKEAAEAANRAKSVFLANMSHELRTPLNAILGYSQLLQRETSLLPEQRESLNTINRSGEHLLALINEVLAISKIEAKQVTLEIVAFDLRALLRDLEMMFESSIERKGLQFEMTGINELPRYVFADENKLRQVMINIMANAVKFTEEGGIAVRVKAKGMEHGAKCENADGNTTHTLSPMPSAVCLMFEIEDTGVGISEDEIDMVFAYFEQTESGRESKSGTGLGLAISRDYVRMMGGDITVTSRKGEGSTFSFKIDIREAGESDFKERTQPRRVIGLAPGQRIPRILVAEDKEDSRSLLVKLLQVVGFEVREAVNGREAIEIFEQWRPHFIWMDIRMPVVDGLEAARRIKETGTGKSTIVAALTAHALEEEREQILAAGCDDFVRKPYREQEIFEVMGKHLEVEYVYEEEQEEEIPVEADVELSPEQLAALPVDLRSRLHQAVVELDTARARALIEQIAAQDAAVGRVFRALTKKLDYSRLLSLLKDKDADLGETS